MSLRCKHQPASHLRDYAGQPELESSSSTAQGTSPWAKVKRFFGGDKLDRKRLKALGVGALLSYGFVSNVTYGGGMAVAWCAPALYKLSVAHEVK